VRMMMSYLKSFEQPGTVSSCLKGLSTALSLRYPLHSAGDPFHSGRHLTLTAVINGLALDDSFSSSSPQPLEAISPRQLGRSVSDRLAAVLALLQGLLPLMRNGSNSALAGTTATVLTLVPAASSRLNLPFVNGKSAADVALISLMESLRRETQCATVGGEKRRKLRFVNLEVGSDMSNQQGSTRASSPGDLPRHLQFYSASIQRRGREATAPLQASSKHRITAKVFKIVLGKGHGHRSSAGRGGEFCHSLDFKFNARAVMTYRVVSMLPSPIVDLFFSAQDYVAASLSRPLAPTSDRPVRSVPSHNSQPRTESAASSEASVSSYPSVPSSEEQAPDMVASISSLSSGVGAASEWQELRPEGDE
jgi:hypothetical protein